MVARVAGCDVRVRFCGVLPVPACLFAQIQKEYQRQRLLANRNLINSRMAAMWDAERSKLIMTQIEKERAWFQTPLGANALKKLVWVRVGSLCLHAPVA